MPHTAAHWLMLAVRDAISAALALAKAAFATPAETALASTQGDHCPVHRRFGGLINGGVDDTEFIGLYRTKSVLRHEPTVPTIRFHGIERANDGLRQCIVPCLSA